MLADSQLKRLLISGHIKLKPLEDNQIQPCSIDLRLGSTFLSMISSDLIIDPLITKPEEYLQREDIAEGEAFLLTPGAFVLASTYEYLELTSRIVAFVEGKSSLGRLGIKTHSTAGLIDPGFKGTITLELTNEGLLPVLLRPGMKICQLTFIAIDGKVERPYGSNGLGSRYQGQIEPEGSRSFLK